jgi:restriction endonuclease S subunit
MNVEVVKLGDVCEVRNGATPSTNDPSFWGGPHQWVTPAEMGDVHAPELGSTRRTLSDLGLSACSATLSPPYSVILSSRAPIGHLVINTVPMATNQGCKTIIPGSRVNHRFLYYLLRASKRELNALGTGATFPELSASRLREFRISIPPIEVQARIVERLDAAVQQTYLVKGALESRRSALREISSAIRHSTFRPREGWSTKTIPDLSTNLDGMRQPVTKADRAAGPFPYYGASGVVDHVDGWIFDEPLLLVSEDGANLLARSTPIAFTASGNYWVNNHAHVLRFASDHLREYVAAYLNSVPIDAWVTGAAQPKLTQANLNRIPIPVPDDEDEIVRAVDAIRATDAITAELEGIETQLEARLGDLDRSLIAAACRGGF